MSVTRDPLDASTRNWTRPCNQKLVLTIEGLGSRCRDAEHSLCVAQDQSCFVLRMTLSCSRGRKDPMDSSNVKLTDEYEAMDLREIHCRLKKCRV